MKPLIDYLTLVKMDETKVDILLAHLLFSTGHIGSRYLHEFKEGDLGAVDYFRHKPQVEFTIDKHDDPDMQWWNVEISVFHLLSERALAVHPMNKSFYEFVELYWEQNPQGKLPRTVDGEDNHHLNSIYENDLLSGFFFAKYIYHWWKDLNETQKRDRSLTLYQRIEKAESDENYDDEDTYPIQGIDPAASILNQHVEAAQFEFHDEVIDCISLHGGGDYRGGYGKIIFLTVPEVGNGAPVADRVTFTCDHLDCRAWWDFTNSSYHGFEQEDSETRTELMEILKPDLICPACKKGTIGGNLSS